MGYLETVAKIENNKELTEEDKLECVADVIKIRLNVKLTKNDKIVMMISDKVGSMWTDTPMPVASQDIPDAIIDFYYEHMAG